MSPVAPASARVWQIAHCGSAISRKTCFPRSKSGSFACGAAMGNASPAARSMQACNCRDRVGFAILNLH